MKFKTFLFLALILVFSCSEVTDNIIENNVPVPKNLEVGIKNNTDFRFIRSEIIADNSTFVYQILEPGEFSEFLEMYQIYSEAEIRIQTADAYFSFSPSHFNEDTKVTNGLYYFEINMNSNQTISITRKTF
ncbi:hypothetical protein [Xanthomarina sp. F2636L]|uniref:hypothetical protein n=1 Tax=Xanthomarina sp. F2636L TaxID=2996018 RepID=UPI00225E2DEE|nr:hypothetical protein [Xanthomarina sp. F2636L]MCX7551286.1 hypothetical protein [Xanthomarina sp. F2636L]